MSDQLVPDGTYTIMGPGGQLSHQGNIVLLQPEGDSTQQWNVAFDSGFYTLRNVDSGMYLGNNGDPDQTAMMVNGTSQPFTWKISTGADQDPDTYLLTSAASPSGLALTTSLLRIWPPQTALLEPTAFGGAVEWTFTPVS